VLRHIGIYVHVYNSVACSRSMTSKHFCLLRVSLRSKPITPVSPQQVRNINDKSVTSWREQKSVVSVVSCRFPNSITTTCCQLAADLLAVSLTSPQKSVTSSQWGSYGGTCVIDSGHKDIASQTDRHTV